MKRGFLLNSLILGASILVWLTILGSVITAYAVVKAQNDSGNTTHFPQPYGGSDGNDDYGVPCRESESKSGC